MDLLTSPDIWIAFLTLLALEIVLGIDNIVFISILVDKLPEGRQALARRLGLGLALVMRIVLLLSLSWVIGLTAPLFTVLSQEISGRDAILILGGLFLLGKATYEIHENLEGEEEPDSSQPWASNSGCTRPPWAPRGALASTGPRPFRRSFGPFLPPLATGYELRRIPSGQSSEQATRTDLCRRPNPALEEQGPIRW